MPTVGSRKIDTTLRVKDNETLVLGGLLRDVDSETLGKVPRLADIPVLGKLFSNRQKTHERDEIIFLLTPHVSYPGEAVRCLLSAQQARVKAKCDHRGKPRDSEQSSTDHVRDVMRAER